MRIVLYVLPLLLQTCRGQEYDFIIVGGGAAGSVLAARLTENPDFQVLLVEAGGHENFVHRIPLTSPMLLLSPSVWQYRSERNDTFATGMKDGTMMWPQGKLLGGFTDAIYTRGNSEDYDNWERLGNTGWGYDNVLPYFLKFENMKIPDLKKDVKYHSTSGTLSVIYPTFRTPLADAFVQSGLELGYNYTDYNARHQKGFSYMQSTLQDGEKCTGYRSFLEPIRHRQNLHIVTRSTVTKVLVDEANKAYGVEYKLFGIINIQVRARKEVIVCAGTINSAQLLMLSGIGPKDHLQSLGIHPLLDAKVGFNLQDHVSYLNLFFTVNQSVSIVMNKPLPFASSFLQYILTRQGQFSVPAGFEAISFIDIGDSDEIPEAELYFGGLILPTIPFYLSPFGPMGQELNQFYQPISSKQGFTIMPVLLRPTSRGTIKLRDKNPFSKPLIYPNFFSVQRDLDILVQATMKALDLVKTEPFQKYNAHLYPEPIPQCKHFEFASTSYWECCIRVLTMTFLHSTGTCKMGPDSDPDAVVDPTLRVKGIENLRVVGAAVMPTVPSAHTIAPVYMVAEKAADMIKKTWKSS